MHSFPTIRFFIRHGELIAAALGLSTIATTIWLVFAYSFGWGLIVVGLMLGAVISFLTMVLVELARIISEMMLPQ